MSGEIISLHDWLTSPPGGYLLAWEQERFDELVVDLFGYHALQLGLPLLDGLRANRMPHHWRAQGNALPLQKDTALLLDPQALPFAEASLDLVLMPHTLETSGAPHAALREAARVLVPQGRVIISGFNPWSLWGLRQRRGQLYQRLGAGGQPFLPKASQLIAPGRVRDWLQLLDFEVESISFGCFRPAVASAPWLQHWQWMDTAGPRWWPILGAAYVVVAVKRVLGMHLLQPAWRSQRQKAKASVPVARSGN